MIVYIDQKVLNLTKNYMTKLHIHLVFPQCKGKKKQYLLIIQGCLGFAGIIFWLLSTERFVGSTTAFLAVYIYIYIYISCRIAGTEFPDPFPILVPIDLEVSEFELQSRNCIHFQSNTLSKDINQHIPLAMS